MANNKEFYKEVKTSLIECQWDLLDAMEEYPCGISENDLDAIKELYECCKTFVDTYDEFEKYLKGK